MTSPTAVSVSLLRAVAVLVIAPAATAGAAVQPYGTNDAGGFRNVLPPGETGSTTLKDCRLQSGRDTAASLRRPAAALRKPRLRGAGADRRRDRRLLQGRHLRGPGRRSRIDDRTETGGHDHPRQSLRRAPHLRRHAGRHDVRSRLCRGERPPLPDGHPPSHRPRRTRLVPRRLQRRGGRAQWGFAPYTEADLQKQLEQAPTDLRGARARRRSKTSQAYVDGINAYVAEARQPAAETGRVRADRHAARSWKSPTSSRWRR